MPMFPQYGKYFIYSQVLLVCIFVVINLLLFIFSVPERPYPEGPLLSATYHGAADGQRYWGVAKNFVENATFTIPALWDSRPDSPLTRAGPIPALFFAIPIKLVGFDQAPALIVTSQCILLYLMGLFSRKLSMPFGVNKTLLQSLVMFNPNLLGLAHFAQSDILFSFFFIIYLLAVNKIIAQPQARQFKSYISVGCLAGLLCLTRDVGLIVPFTFPFILFVVVILQRNKRKIVTRNVFVGLVSSAIIFAMVSLPWSARNYRVFGQFAPVIGETHQLHYMFLRLLYIQGDTTSLEREGLISNHLDKYLGERGNKHCLGQSRPTKVCKKVLRNAYIRGIFSQPLESIIRASLYATARTILTGGTSRLAISLGYSKSNLTADFMETYKSFNTLKQSAVSLLANNPGYLLVFILATGFSVISRLVGLIGLSRLVRRDFFNTPNFFYIITIVCFLGAYFVVSAGRFRAPLEPILMLYTCLGLTYIKSYISPNSSH